MKTHYEMLGVAESADAETIRSAYRRLVLQLHPDRSKAPGAAEQFMRVTEAYEVLSDPERRRSYDGMLRAQRQPAEPARASAGPTANRRPTAPRFSSDPVHLDSAVRQRLQTLLRQGRIGEAEIEAKRLTEEHPRAAEPYAVLGDIALQRGMTRKAAEMYGYAAQFDPTNDHYARLHERLIQDMGPLRDAVVQGAGEERVPTQVIVGAIVVVICGTYLALSRERPIFSGIPLISSWTFGYLAMAMIAGIVTGVSLSLGRMLDRFSTMTQAASLRVAPTMALTAVAVVNFWLAALVYFIVGASQDAFNNTTSRLVGSVMAVTVFLAIASSAQGIVRAEQALIWGGNLVYLGAMLGWFVADSLRVR